MIVENIAPAKAKLSGLVNAALSGEEVVLCKNGEPVVRLIPIHPMSYDDPCRVIKELVIKAGEDAVNPLAEEDWGALAE